MRTTSAFKTVRCPGCGNVRELTSRQAQRAGLCQLCLRPNMRIKVTDTHRNFWLKQFTDDQELAELASQYSGHRVSPVRVRQYRLALTAAAKKQEP